MRKYEKLIKYYGSKQEAEEAISCDMRYYNRSRKNVIERLHAMITMDKEDYDSLNINREDY